MIVTLKALSALLTYPTPDLQAAAPEIGPALAREGLLPPSARTALAPLLDELATRDLIDLQERFVLLFDRSRSLSLNLFKHIHGESRARGQAMVDLLDMYRAGGFEPVGPELPDHLPILAGVPEPAPAVRGARDAGRRRSFARRPRRTAGPARSTPYASVLRAVAALAAAELITELAAAPEDDPEDLAALDAVWEETQVALGPNPDAGCPAGRDILARMAAPLSPPAAAR